VGVRRRNKEKVKARVKESKTKKEGEGTRGVVGVQKWINGFKRTITRIRPQK